MTTNQAVFVLQKALRQSRFDSRYPFFVRERIKGGSDTFYTRAVQDSVAAAERQLEDWNSINKFSTLADGVKLVVRAMLVLATHRPELASWLIINERTPYQFPLSYRMSGYSDLVVLFLPSAKASGCGEYLAALKAVAVHFGNTEEGNQAQISLLLEPGESKVRNYAVGFDALSFDLYGHTRADQIRRLSDEEGCDLKTLVLSTLEGNSASDKLSHGSGPLSIISWSPDRLASSLLMISDHLCILAIRD